MRGVFRLFIGVNAVLLLEGGLAGHAVECICTQIDVIADRAGVRDAQALIRIPLCAVLGGQLHAAEDADGVSCIGVDGLTLLDEVALHCEQIVFVHGCGCQSEIIIGYRQVGDVHIDILVELELYRHLSFRTDALCQLEQQIPSCNTGNITNRLYCCNHKHNADRHDRFRIKYPFDRHDLWNCKPGCICHFAPVDNP